MHVRGPNDRSPIRYSWLESESPAQQFVVVQIANGFSDHGDRFVVLPAEGRPLYRLAERLRKLIQRSRQRQPAVSDADHLWGAKLKEGRSGGLSLSETLYDWLCWANRVMLRLDVRCLHVAVVCADQLASLEGAA